MRFGSICCAIAIVLVAANVPVASVTAEEGALKTVVEAFDGQDYGKARQLLEKLRRDGELSAALFYYLGRLDLIDGDHESAVKCLEQAIDIDPGISEYHYWLSVAVMRTIPYSNLLGKMRSTMRAVKGFNTAIELDPKNMTARMILFRIMVSSFERGGVKKERLIDQARAIAEIDSAMGCVAFGTYYQVVEGDMKRASEEYEKGYGLDPGNRAVVVSCADYLWLAGERDEAIRILDSYVHEKPNDKQGHFATGAKIVLGGKDYHAAREHFETCLLLKSENGMPTEAMVRWCLGLVHHLTGEQERAEAEWSKVHELDGKFDRILEASPQMSELNSLLGK